VELRHLRYFTAVAENGGFARAARLLHISQSAISEQMESELGIELLNRENRRIRLTDRGEHFLKDARAILTTAEKAVANVQKSLRGEIGTLTIGFFVGGTGTFFPRIIREFRRRFQGVQVSLVELAPAMQHQALQAGAIDVGFTRPIQPQYAAFLRSEPFHTEKLCVVLLKSHRLAKKHKISIRDLATEHFVLNDRKYSPLVFDRVIALCAEARYSPRISATATVSPGILALVEAGEGIAILAEGAQALSSDELVFVPLSDRSASVDMVIAWSPQNETPALRSFLELAKKKRGKLLRNYGLNKP
jgi:DNA-binding transcriptional LysR family regulator